MASETTHSAPVVITLCCTQLIGRTYMSLYLSEHTNSECISADFFGNDPVKFKEYIADGANGEPRIILDASDHEHKWCKVVKDVGGVVVCLCGPRNRGFHCQNSCLYLCKQKEWSYDNWGKRVINVINLIFEDEHKARSSVRDEESA